MGGGREKGSERGKVEREWEEEGRNGVGEEILMGVGGKG